MDGLKLPFWKEEMNPLNKSPKARDRASEEANNTTKYRKALEDRGTRKKLVKKERDEEGHQKMLPSFHSN